MDGLAASMARISAEALLGRADSIGSDDFLVALSEALVLSGIAMGIAGTSRPCSGLVTKFLTPLICYSQIELNLTVNKLEWVLCLPHS